MNPWLITAVVMLGGVASCAYTCFRGTAPERLVGLEAAGTFATITLMLLAEGFGRAPFLDLALALALLTFGGGLVFARFFERWM